RARSQEVAQVGPVVRRPVRELEYHLLRAAANAAAAACPAKLARRPAVGAAERVVETAAAAETGRHRDLRDRQAGLGQQAHREMRSEEHTSELQSLRHIVCRLLLEKENNQHMR